MVLDNNEGRGNFKGVNVGVEGVYKIEHSKLLSKHPNLTRQPGASHAILICSVVELVVEIRMASFHTELYYILTIRTLH